MGKAKLLIGCGSGKLEISNATVTKGIISSKLSKPAFVTQSPKATSVSYTNKSMGSVSLGGDDPAIGIMDNGDIIVAFGTDYSTGYIAVCLQDGTVLSTEGSASRVYDAYCVFQVEKGKFCIVGRDLNNYVQYAIFTYTNSGITYVSSGTISTNYLTYLSRQIVHRRNGKYRLYTLSSSTLYYMEFSVSNNTLSVTTGSITMTTSFNKNYTTWYVQGIWDSNKLFIVGHYSKSSSYTNYYRIVDLDTGTVETVLTTSSSSDMYKGPFSVAFDGTYYYYITGVYGYEYTLHKMEKIDGSWTEVASLLVDSPSTYWPNLALGFYEGLLFIYSSSLIIVNTTNNTLMQNVKLTAYGEPYLAAMAGKISVKYGHYYASSGYPAVAQNIAVNSEGIFNVEIKRSSIEVVMPANAGNVLVDCYA